QCISTHSVGASCLTSPKLVRKWHRANVVTATAVLDIRLHIHLAAIGLLPVAVQPSALAFGVALPVLACALAVGRRRRTPVMGFPAVVHIGQTCASICTTIPHVTVNT
ncbi:hypothetical protein M758_1G295100, partial [Ceratodon purpureus]